MWPEPGTEQRVLRTPHQTQTISPPARRGVPFHVCIRPCPRSRYRATSITAGAREPRPTFRHVFYRPPEGNIDMGMRMKCTRPAVRHGQTQAPNYQSPAPARQQLSLADSPAPLLNLLVSTLLISGPFHSLVKVLFIFPSQYLFAIGLPDIFSLTSFLPRILRWNPNQRDS